jgi:hypothetical protein
VQHLIAALDGMTACVRSETATLEAIVSPDPFADLLASIDLTLDGARRTFDRAGDEARMDMRMGALPTEPER